MPANVPVLAASLLLILLASALFTNGIELVGKRLGTHQGAVGSILAAVGTALPETVIPMVAILGFRDPQSRQVAIGAIVGAPFMLATLAFFVTAMAVLVFAAMGRRNTAMAIEPRGVARDMTFFIVAYGLAVLTTFVHGMFILRVCVAAGLLISYGLYVRKTILAEGVYAEQFDVLWFRRVLKVPENLFWILAQVIAATAIMIWVAHLFVQNIDALSANLGVSALTLSIIVTPVATELPEKFNSIIWIGKNRDILAVGNITGAMVFQSSFPVVFGILFTDWSLSGLTLLSAVLALASAAGVLAWVKLRKTLVPYVLLAGGAIYAAFLIFALRSL